MSRSPILRQLSHLARLHRYCQTHQRPIEAGLDLLTQAREERSRRSFVSQSPNPAASDPQIAPDRPQTSGNPPSIGIVGAGLAGLACAYELQQAGIVATIYEANDRAGGRCWSMGGAFGEAAQFPGQVIERGGELIDSEHRVILNYAREFGLALEDLSAVPGEVAFYFQGQHYREADILAEYDDLLRAIAPDLAQLSRQPTARCHTPFDRAIDEINLADYLEKHQAGDLIKRFIYAGYQGEYGLDPDEQTSLHFLLLNFDKAQDPEPLRIFSDEKYHILGGNEQIVTHLCQRLAQPIAFNTRLIRIRRTPDRQIELTFDRSGRAFSVCHDAAVITIPFPCLRSVELDDSLELPPWKRSAIAQLDNGSQAKLMLSFCGRPWQTHGSNGESYSDLPHHQVTWEANPTGATSTQGTIVHLVSGRLGASLNPDRTPTEAETFLADFDRIYPGAQAQARRTPQGTLCSHLEQWSSHPWSQGSYLCYRPGQLTRFAELEGAPIHNLFFAGEHTDSFHEWQGFLEGAARSGVAAAQQITQTFGLQSLKKTTQ